jgi:formylglycine-generating enzyme required for sulfatase activity
MGKADCDDECDPARAGCMSRAIRRAVLAIVVVTTPASTQIAVVQSVQTIGAEPSLQSRLGATASELKDLRLARPLSRNEEIALRPLDQFKESELCPEMIVAAAGQFLMGAKDGEVGSTPSERPQHWVRFAQPFAAGRFPVTISEWDACVAARGCSYRPVDHRGWG